MVLELLVAPALRPVRPAAVCPAEARPALHSKRPRSLPTAARMNNVKFKRMVGLGETLDIFVQLQDRLQDAFDLRGRVEVDGSAATTLDFVTTAAEHPST